MKVIEEEPQLHVMEGPWTPHGVIEQVVEGGQQEDAFYVMDMGMVVARFKQWKELMPRVEPFYAVKCNDDKMMVSTLATLGTGFDCASKGEIELVTSIGVDPQRIIFANPAKLASHIRYASTVGVDTMTFDSETELYKVKQYMPHAKLVIRIRCDAANAQCPLGIKFGCDPVTEAPRLLKLAAVIGLEVVGVSFHVGSGAMETSVYKRAIQLARALFALGAGVGHAHMTLLDIGGGFPGATDSSIREVAQVINSALEANFPSEDVRVIAEPGRYFAAAAYTLATLVYAKRELVGKEEGGAGEPHTMYFINDGVYGSFNCVLYDHQHVAPTLLKPSPDKPQPCSIWGPTCDGLDCVVPGARLPALRPGAWLVWRDMGAYTLPVASPFNGFPVPTVRYLVDKHVWGELRDKWPLPSTAAVCGAYCGPGAAPPAPAPAPAPAPPDNTQHLHAVFVECALK